MTERAGTELDLYQLRHFAQAIALEALRARATGPRTIPWLNGDFAARFRAAALTEAAALADEQTHQPVAERNQAPFRRQERRGHDVRKSFIFFLTAGQPVSPKMSFRSQKVPS